MTIALMSQCSTATQLNCTILSLRFNGDFPGEPWLAGVYIEAKDDGGGGDNWTTGDISRAKLQSNHHYQPLLGKTCATTQKKRKKSCIFGF